MTRLLREAIRTLGIESVRHQGQVLPAPHLRSAGPEFKDDAYFLKSARAEATRLVDDLGLTAESRVLEIGCGAGRLPIGLLGSGRSGLIGHGRHFIFAVACLTQRPTGTLQIEIDDEPAGLVMVSTGGGARQRRRTEQPWWHVRAR